MARAANIFRILSLAYYAFVSYTLFVTNPKKVEANEELRVLRTLHRFSLRYLTNWTYLLQMSYLVLSVFTMFLSLISAHKLKRRIELFNDYVFTAISTPIALLVSCLFWTVYSFDREMVFPKILDLIIPFWLNHSVHTLNSVLAIVDLCLCRHTFFSWGKSYRGLLAFLIAYLVCLFGTYLQTGVWLYPLLAVLTVPQKIVFFLGVLVMVTAAFALTRGINSLVWGYTVNEKVKTQSRKQKTK